MLISMPYANSDNFTYNTCEINILTKNTFYNLKMLGKLHANKCSIGLQNAKVW